MKDVEEAGWLCLKSVRHRKCLASSTDVEWTKEKKPMAEQG